MSKPTPEHFAIPADLSALLESAGLVASLAVSRQDGAPLTSEDRKLLPELVEGYEVGHELNPSKTELSAAVAQVLKANTAAPLAPTGTGGE